MIKLFTVTTETTLPKILEMFLREHSNKSMVEAIIEYCADQIDSDFENQLLTALQKFKADNE